MLGEAAINTLQSFVICTQFKKKILSESLNMWQRAPVLDKQCWWRSTTDPPLDHLNPAGGGPPGHLPRGGGHFVPPLRFPKYLRNAWVFQNNFFAHKMNT